MSRRYLEPVVVRAGSDHAPRQFIWRGRRYRVRQILDHWIEGGAWWRRLQRTAAGSSGPRSGRPPDPLVDRQIWRVEASASGSQSLGVYDLCCDSARWHLARALD